MIAVNVLLIIIWAIIIPSLTGYLALVLTGRKKEFVFSESLMFGFVIFCAVFYLLAFPMIRMKLPFSYVKNCWIALILILSAVSLCIFVKNKMVKELLIRIRGIKNIELKKEDVVLWFIAVMIILSQTLLLTLFMHMDTDDSRFIAEGMEAFEKNTMLMYNPITGDYTGGPVGEMIKDMSCPFPIFYALLACLFKLHPAVVAHTVLPLLLIPLSYVIFYNAMRLLIVDDRRSLALSLIFLSLIYYFYYGTKASAGYILLEIIWQGRSVAAVIMLPVAWYMMLHFILDEKITPGHYILLVLTGLMASLLSGMGAVLFAFFVFGHIPAILIIRMSVKQAFFALIALIPSFISMLDYADRLFNG
ncbi:MAG: hypothetical protein K6B28_00335 [Lachnospiraceae bacterium]|nr:hypothetical protein [Lachnospiraceae bacterium]